MILYIKGAFYLFKKLLLLFRICLSLARQRSASTPISPIKKNAFIIFTDAAFSFKDECNALGWVVFFFFFISSFL